MIPVARPLLSELERKYVMDCLETGWVSSIGPYITEFESRFAAFCEVPHAATCANGTVALHLALLALGLGPGDEVIVPTLTYVATANAVVYCGATPVLVDSEPDTMNLDPSCVEAAITPRTKAVIAVHLYGHPADMRRLREVCAPHGVRLVEDAAEAHGARQDGRPVGSLGDIATFSFFGNKIITTGEGGMVTTADRELDRAVRLFRGQGQDPDRRYWFPVVGYNYRLTNVAAAIGLGQLESVELHLASRADLAHGYDERLEAHRDAFHLPATRPDCTRVNWLYTLVLDDAVDVPRDEVMRRLAEDGIESRPVFYPMHAMPVFESREAFPVADRLGGRGISLPTFSEMTNDDLDQVCGGLLRAIGR